MKLINKSILTVLAALGCGQVVAFPIEITQLTKGEGEEKITIYMFGDRHEPDKNDEKNVNYIIQLANSTGATVLLENPWNQQPLPKTSIPNICTQQDLDEQEPAFLINLCKNKNKFKKINDFDPRNLFHSAETTYKKNVKNMSNKEKYEGITKIIGEIDRLHTHYTKLAQSEEYRTLKEYYAQQLKFFTHGTNFACAALKTYRENQNDNDALRGEKISNAVKELALKFIFDTNIKQDKYCDNIDNISNYLVNPGMVFTDTVSLFMDLELLVNIQSAINSGKKNLIIIAGQAHTNWITQPLNNLGFATVFKNTILKKSPSGFPVLQSTTDLEKILPIKDIKTENMPNNTTNNIPNVPDQIEKSKQPTTDSTIPV